MDSDTHPKRVVVTDGEGFAGSCLLSSLTARALQAESLPSHENLCHPKMLLEHFAGADAVIHTYFVDEDAAKGSRRRAQEALLTHNVSYTENALNAAKSAGIRTFVHVSSADATLCDLPRIFWNESRSAPSRTLSTYVHSRLLAEELVLAAGDEDFKTIVLRPGRLWGPGDTKWLPQLVRAARHRALRLPGGGNTLAALTHIDHLSEAVYRALNAPFSTWGAFYIADAEPLTWREWMTQLCKALTLPLPRNGPPAVIARGLARAGLGRPPFYGSPERACEFTFAAHFDCGNATRHLGYRSAIETDAAMDQLRACFLTRGIS